MIADRRAGIGRSTTIAALLALAACGTASEHGDPTASQDVAGEIPAANEMMPASLPVYPGAQSLRIRDMEYARGMPPLPFATFQTTDSPAQVAEFYTAAAERAGFEQTQRRDNPTSIQMTFRNELHRLSINSQNRDDGKTSTQLGLAVRPDRRNSAGGG